MRFALLLSTQRSGTNLLRRILNSNPEIDMLFGEIMNPAQMDNPLSFHSFFLEKVTGDPKRCLPGHRLKLFQNYLKMLEQRRPGKIKILDIKYNSLHHLHGWWSGPRDMVAEFWEENDIPVIHLIRQNIPKTLVSLRAAEQTGVWVSHGQDNKAAAKKVHIDPKQLLEDIELFGKDRAVMCNRYRKLSRYREVFYEELMSPEDPGRINEPTFAALADFLGIEPEFEPGAPIKKIITGGMEDKIENYDEVSSALSQAGLGWEAGDQIGV